MGYEHIRFETADGVATIMLHRPERMNAYTARMGAELDDALWTCDRQDDIRAVVVSGTGRAFCAGADLEGGGRIFDEGAATAETRPAQARRPWHVRKPIIAAINGAAVGVGATLPLQWDIRIAGESARIGFVFVRRGIIPEAASTWTLPRIIGLSRAAELLYTGRILNAREALEYGVVSRVLPDAELLPAAQAMARDIAANTGPVAVALTKRLLWHMQSVPDPDEAHRLDTPAFYWSTQTPDAREGIRSFLEKRPPRWSMKPSSEVPELESFRTKR
jgi:enoyl-CoA hydratase/carnithine racemase